MLAVNLGTGTPERQRTLWSIATSKAARAGAICADSTASRNHTTSNTGVLGMKWTAHGNWAHVRKRIRPQGADAALQMRTVDPSIRLIACGSSEVGMPTYLEWDRQTLEECYDDVDAISLHHYFGNGPETGGDSAKFLAANLVMDRQIEGDHRRV